MAVVTENGNWHAAGHGTTHEREPQKKKLTSKPRYP
jgi:hypothetical protein